MTFYNVKYKSCDLLEAIARRCAIKSNFKRFCEIHKIRSVLVSLFYLELQILRAKTTFKI